MVKSKNETKKKTKNILRKGETKKRPLKNKSIQRLLKGGAYNTSQKFTGRVTVLEGGKLKFQGDDYDYKKLDDASNARIELGNYFLNVPIATKSEDSDDKGHFFIRTLDNDIQSNLLYAGGGVKIKIYEHNYTHLSRQSTSGNKESNKTIQYNVLDRKFIGNSQVIDSTTLEFDGVKYNYKIMTPSDGSPLEEGTYRLEKVDQQDNATFAYRNIVKLKDGYDDTINNTTIRIEINPTILLGEVELIDDKTLKSGSVQYNYEPMGETVSSFPKTYELIKIQNEPDDVAQNFVIRLLKTKVEDGSGYYEEAEVPIKIFREPIAPPLPQSENDKRELKEFDTSIFDRIIDIPRNLYKTTYSGRHILVNLPQKNPVDYKGKKIESSKYEDGNLKIKFEDGTEHESYYLDELYQEYLQTEFDNTTSDLETISLGDRLGEGHFGSVYKFEQGGEESAIKVIKDFKDDYRVKFLRLKIEQEFQKILDHPNISKSFGIFKILNPPDNVFNYGFKMEKCQGSLDKLMSTTEDEPLIEYIKQVSAGLWYLHSLKLIQGDIAARNILLCGTDTITAKISDFGLTRCESYSNNRGIESIPFFYSTIKSNLRRKISEYYDILALAFMVFECVYIKVKKGNFRTTIKLNQALKQFMDGEGDINLSIFNLDLSIVSDDLQELIKELLKAGRELSKNKIPSNSASIGYTGETVERPDGLDENCNKIKLLDELISLPSVTKNPIRKEGQLFVTKSFPLGGVLKSKGEFFELEFKVDEKIPERGISTTAGNRPYPILTTTIFINKNGEFKTTQSIIEREQPYIELKNSLELKTDEEGLFKIEGLFENHGLSLSNPVYELTTPQERFFVLAGDGKIESKTFEKDGQNLTIKNLKLNNGETAELIGDLNEIPFPIIDTQNGTSCGCHAINNLLGERKILGVSQHFEESDKKDNEVTRCNGENGGLETSDVYKELTKHTQGKVLKVVNTVIPDNIPYNTKYLEHIINESPDDILGFIELDANEKHYFVWKMFKSKWYKIDSRINTEIGNIEYPKGQGYEGDINSLSKHYGVITQEDPRISGKREQNKHVFIVLLSKDIDFDDREYKLNMLDVMTVPATEVSVAPPLSGNATVNATVNATGPAQGDATGPAQGDATGPATQPTQGTATEGNGPRRKLLEEIRTAQGDPGGRSLSLKDMNDCMNGIVYNDDMKILPINAESMSILQKEKREKFDLEGYLKSFLNEYGDKVSQQYKGVLIDYFYLRFLKKCPQGQCDANKKCIRCLKPPAKLDAPRNSPKQEDEQQCICFQNVKERKCKNKYVLKYINNPNKEKEPNLEFFYVIYNELSDKYVSLSEEINDADFTKIIKEYESKKKPLQEYVIHDDENYYNNIKYFKDIVNGISKGFSEFSGKETNLDIRNKYIALVLPYFYVCDPKNIDLDDCDFSGGVIKIKDFITHLNEVIEIPEVSRTVGTDDGSGAESTASNRAASNPVGTVDGSGSQGANSVIASATSNVANPSPERTADLESQQPEEDSGVARADSTQQGQCPEYKPFFTDDNVVTGSVFTGKLGKPSFYGGGWRNIQLGDVKKGNTHYNDIVLTYNENRTKPELYILWKSWIVVEILEPPLGGRKQQDYFMSDEIRSKEFKFQIRNVASEPEKSVSSGAAGTSATGTSTAGTSGAGTSGAGTSTAGTSGEDSSLGLNKFFIEKLNLKNEELKELKRAGEKFKVKFDSEGITLKEASDEAKQKFNASTMPVFVHDDVSSLNNDIDAGIISFKDGIVKSKRCLCVYKQKSDKYVINIDDGEKMGDIQGIKTPRLPTRTYCLNKTEQGHFMCKKCIQEIKKNNLIPHNLNGVNIAVQAIDNSLKITACNLGMITLMRKGITGIGDYLYNINDLKRNDLDESKQKKLRRTLSYFVPEVVGTTSINQDCKVKTITGKYGKSRASVSREVNKTLKLNNNNRNVPATVGGGRTKKVLRRNKRKSSRLSKRKSNRSR